MDTITHTVKERKNTPSTAALATNERPLGSALHKTTTQRSRQSAFPSAVALAAVALFGLKGLAQPCYDESNVGKVLTTGPCAGMLIVDRDMLDKATPTADSSDLVITRDGVDYTFGNSDKNIFTGQVTSMGGLFRSKSKFNAAIDYWDVSKVTDMGFMFNIAESFNQPLGSWDVSSVTDMEAMFQGATAFNQPLNDWDVSSVTDMGFMFNIAESFNQPLDNWDVSSVTDMGSMFNIAESFNQPLGSWDVSSVKDMWSMFFIASAFDQDLSCWNVAQISSEPGSFSSGSKLKSENKPKWGTSGCASE